MLYLECNHCGAEVESEGPSDWEEGDVCPDCGKGTLRCTDEDEEED